VTRCHRLPAVSASQIATSKAPVASSGTHPNEPESEQMQLLCPELVAASETPASPMPVLASQV
jgi:hypothetical protein